jgi:hypothetical protein
MRFGQRAGPGIFINRGLWFQQELNKVSDRIASILHERVTKGRLSLHFLPGYAPELNRDELVWSDVKRTGTARRPLQQGEKLAGGIDQKLADVREIQSLSAHFSQVLPSPIFVTAE